MDESSQVRSQFRASECKPWQTAADPGRRVEPTSQAEHAGSIPVIACTLITADAARRCSTRSLAVMSASSRRNQVVGFARCSQNVTEA
jgi:hypothetical protein